MPIARKGAKRPWRAPANPINPVTGATANVPIPEPRHRLGPAGVSSGLSVRQQPKSTVQKVREICLHYVGKVSGKYELNQAAARYVHQMADEIMGQLAGVIAQIKNARDQKPEHFQELLDEWQKHFPPSLGAIGTPKHVAATLERYTKELADLRNELEAERAKRAQEVAGVLKSMDAQLQASNLGVMSERRQLSYAQQQQTKDFERALKDAEAQARAKLTALAQTYEEKARRTQEEHNRRLREVMKMTESLQEELRDERSNAGSAIRGVQETRRREAEKQSALIAKLKEEMLVAQGVQPVHGPPGGVDGGISTVSLSLNDSDEKSPELEPEPEVEPSATSISFIPEPRYVQPLAREQPPPTKTKRQLAGPVGKAVKGLKDKIAELTARLDEAHVRAQELTDRLKPAEEERNLLQQQVREMKETNEALRKALSMQVLKKVDDSGRLAAVTYRAPVPEPVGPDMHDNVGPFFGGKAAGRSYDE